MANATAKIITASTPDGEKGDVLQLKNCSYASFRLADLIIEAGKPYTFTIKMKAAATMQVDFTVLGSKCDPVTVTTKWTEVYFVIEKPSQNFILISPNSDSELLLWQAMLQSGTVSTGWVPAPEDTDDQIEDVVEKYSSLQQDVNGIRTEVRELKKDASGTYATKTELSQTAAEIRAEAESAIATADAKYASKSSLSQTASEIRTEIQSSAESADKKYASKSELTQTADQITTSVNNEISGLSSQLQQFADSITLQVVKADGTKTNIKISSDGIITLNGTTMAQYIDVDKLMARDMTATGTFNVDNGKYVLKADSSTIKIGRPSPYPDDSYYFPNQITFDDNSVNIGGAGQRNLVDVNISGNIDMYGNLTLRSGGSWLPLFKIQWGEIEVGWMGYTTGSTGSTQTAGIGIGTNDGGYFISTDSGVRAQIGDYSIYLTKNGQARITGLGGTIQIEDNGIYLTGPVYYRESSNDSWTQLRGGSYVQ